MTKTNDSKQEVAKLIQKYTDYCECEEYHYGETHDSEDGHMEFDEDELEAAIQALLAERERSARLDEVTLGFAAWKTEPEYFAARIKELTDQEAKDE